MASTIIEVKNLVKRYGERTVVDDVSFSVAEGEIFGLLGPNGAGKSTTISILSTLLDFDEGEIRIGGFDLRHEKDQVKRIIGLVPQDLAIYPELSARENLMFMGRIYGLTGTVLKVRVQEVLELTELADRADQQAATFSGGMKRRLNIGAGLMHEPRILFLDEPTVGVDPQSRNFIFEHIERLNRKGMAVIYTTHYMEEAERLCHRLAIVDRGRVVAMDTVRGLLALAGDGLIYLTVPHESGERVRAVLESTHGIKAAALTNGQVKIEAQQVNDALVKVIAVCNEHRIPILSLELLKPNLETVFLHLTGKRLRD